MGLIIKAEKHWDGRSQVVMHRYLPPFIVVSRFVKQIENESTVQWHLEHPLVQRWVGYRWIIWVLNCRQEAKRWDIWDILLGPEEQTPTITDELAPCWFEKWPWHWFTAMMVIKPYKVSCCRCTGSHVRLDIGYVGSCERIWNSTAWRTVSKSVSTGNLPAKHVDMPVFLNKNQRLINQWHYYWQSTPAWRHSR